MTTHLTKEELFARYTIRMTQFIQHPEFNPSLALRVVQDVKNSEHRFGLNKKALVAASKVVRRVAEFKDATPTQCKWAEILMGWIYTSAQNNPRMALSVAQRQDLLVTACALKNKGVPSINQAMCDAVISNLQMRTAAKRKPMAYAAGDRS